MRLFQRAFAVWCIALATASAAQDAAETPVTTVGLPLRLDGVVLEGARLVERPGERTDALRVRIIESWPHGTAFRYDLEVTGFEPGTYDALDALQAEDGSAAEGNVPVRVDSVLAAERLRPSTPDAGTVGRLGGYRAWMVAGGVLWAFAGLALWFSGRAKRREAMADAQGLRGPSLADRLRPMVEDAVAGRLSDARRAELEMSLLAYWRERLGRKSDEPAELIAALKAHEEAGPLVRGLEEWLHAPPTERTVDVASLLKPYESVRDHTAPATTGAV